MLIKRPEKLLFHETLYSLSISNIVNYIGLSTGILAGIGICLIQSLGKPLVLPVRLEKV